MGAALREHRRTSNRLPAKLVAKEIGPVERRISFCDLARMAWPHKTEDHLSAATGYDKRTCQRWLAEDSEPPAHAAVLVLNKITRLYLTRSS